MKLINSLLMLLCASTFLSAQQPITPPSKPAKRVHRVLKPPSSATANSPNKTPSDFFVGEARVNVTKDETVVRLAMAQHGSILIELPANDGPRYIIPGDPEMATVDEKALERNKRAIVVRPGTQFVTPRHNVKAITPSATVTAQMRSGLVVTFLFYPVEDLAQNVHRCVLNYNRDEVVARRRAAGLPVNLDDKEQGGEKTTAQSTVAPISVGLENPNCDKAKEPESSSPSKVKEEVKETGLSLSIGNSTFGAISTGPNSEVSTSLRNALNEAAKRPKRFKNWTHATRGLKLSILQDADSGRPFKVVTVAVKNNAGEPLQLLANSPELLVETIDESGLTVDIHSIANIQRESSNTSGVIAPGATLYFAIAYASPTLDVRQRLKIEVTQTNAADQPASIKLAPNGR